jgi:hypothetical protein
MHIRVGLAGVTLGLCAIGFGSGDVPTAVKRDRDHRRTVLPTREDVESALEKQEALGQKAMDVLKDTSRDPEERRDAALIIGRLRYRPAIPGLLKQLDSLKVEVQPPPSPFPGGIGGQPKIDIEGMYPCVVALAAFGMEAVPETVQAFLDEKASDMRLFLLYYSLANRPVGEPARCYIIGLRNGTRNPFVRERLDDLLSDGAIR